MLESAEPPVQDIRSIYPELQNRPRDRIRFTFTLPDLKMEHTVVAIIIIFILNA